MLARPKNRRKQKSVSRQWLPAIDWRRWAVSALSMAGVCAAIGGVAWAVDQPIETVSVMGPFQRVTPAEVERTVKDRVRGAGLVSIDLDEMRLAIEALPWIESASVQRVWPRGLQVNVVEQIAAARWGERGLLNTRGELFVKDAQHVPPELAQLSGPEGAEQLVARRYLAAQGRLVGAGVRLTALRLDARGAWELDLDNGIKVRLGRRHVDERFETFMLTALRLVVERADDISYVDMRYTNGFAIGWRGAAASHRERKDEGGNRDV